MAQMVKNLPGMQKPRVHSLDGEDFLEKEMSTHSSIGRVQSMRPLKSPQNVETEQLYSTGKYSQHSIIT